MCLWCQHEEEEEGSSTCSVLDCCQSGGGDTNDTVNSNMLFKYDNNRKIWKLEHIIYECKAYNIVTYVILITQSF